MVHPRNAPPLLVKDALPELTLELKEALTRQGEGDLATQVERLEIKSLCGCDDDFCGSFYVGDRPKGAWADEGDHASVGVEGSESEIVLDVVDGRIRYVEVLFRPDLKEKLSRAFGR